MGILESLLRESNIYISRLCEAAANHLAFLCAFSHLLVGRAGAPVQLKDHAMTLYHAIPDESPVREDRRFSTGWAIGRIGAALKTIHDAIVTAKLRRIRRELMLHRRWVRQAEPDAATLPQRPLILGDKWDF